MVAVDVYPEDCHFHARLLECKRLQYHFLLRGKVCPFGVKVRHGIQLTSPELYKRQMNRKVFACCCDLADSAPVVVTPSTGWYTGRH